MKVYIYSHHLGQNMGVQNVILPQLYLITLFSVLFLLFIDGFLPTRGRETDYIISMALYWFPSQSRLHPC